ncbi:hypothetical protein KGF57_004008 [Candida theae]|uniref:Uncharacterized protein n=1 Tax=Candida theae TaxID=1198502 RepID=A0AAD5FXF5_9ASCO|nr:uncharacterized protein KGF57_004008 [Candida theae]KAI5953016.1 hypothetical protein KGF57_004008 [Candida theae]
MPQLQPDYYVSEVASSKYTQPPVKQTRGNNKDATTSTTTAANSKTYLKFKAKFSKFRQNAIIKLRIANKSTSLTKSVGPSSKSKSRSRSSSTSTIFVDDVSKSEDESGSCCYCDKMPDCIVTTTECSPRISLDELQDSLVESAVDKEVLVSVDEEKKEVTIDKDDGVSTVPSCPPPQYKAVEVVARDGFESTTSVKSRIRLHKPSSVSNLPIKPTQIKFKSQLNQYLATLEKKEPTKSTLTSPTTPTSPPTPTSIQFEPYLSLKQYNKTTDQQYSQYKLINKNEAEYHCVDYYWLYLDIRSNSQLVSSLYMSWYSWMSGMITFMIVYALYVCLS